MILQLFALKVELIGEIMSVTLVMVDLVVTMMMVVMIVMLMVIREIKVMLMTMIMLVSDGSVPEWPQEPLRKCLVLHVFHYRHR